jgi:glyoxylase-like metal-dependent hydrolase (beta-lactamase superfamily II)
MNIYPISTGYCSTHENIVLKGSKARGLKAHALAFLIEHPSGWMLFDTGYTPKVTASFKHWPYTVYGWLTPVFLGQTVAEQLPRFGITSLDIKRVIVSHFHADHIGGLTDFPNTRFVASRESWEHVQNKVGWKALKQGFIPLLMPEDFAERTDLVEFDSGPLPHLGPTHDLLGDGSLRLVSLPGHARGQMGLLAGNTLLVADGCWHSKALRQNIPPSSLAIRSFFDNPKSTYQTLHNLHLFHLSHPHVTVWPTHCPEVAEAV